MKMQSASEPRIRGPREPKPLSKTKPNPYAFRHLVSEQQGGFGRAERNHLSTSQTRVWSIQGGVPLKGTNNRALESSDSQRPKPPFDLPKQGSIENRGVCPVWSIQGGKELSRALFRFGSSRPLLNPKGPRLVRPRPLDLLGPRLSTSQTLSLVDSRLGLRKAVKYI